MPKEQGAGTVYGLRVNGAEIDATSGSTYAVNSPASGQYVATFADADSQDVDMAVITAAHAFDSGEWRRMSATARSVVLTRIAELLLERQDELALKESLCSGKAIRDCRGDVAAAAR